MSGSEKSAGNAAWLMHGRTVWTQVCTYAGNRLRILRCEVCDAVRGTAWDYFMGGQAQQEAAGSQHQQQELSTAGCGGATKEAAPAHAAARPQALPVAESTGSREQVEGRVQDIAGSSRQGEGEQAPGMVQERRMMAHWAPACGEMAPSRAARCAGVAARLLGRVTKQSMRTTT